MRRSVIVLAVALASLVWVASASAHDCIRVSVSAQGAMQSSSHSGRWLLFDFRTADATGQTLGMVGVPVTGTQAGCITDAYAGSGQPQVFTLGLGVAGPNGVLAHHNPNDRVLSDGHGIDHLDDSPILPALFGAAAGCGVDLSGAGG